MDISSPLPPLRPSSVDDNNEPASSTPKPSHVHPRSCTFCRHRKVKCDRQQPCSNCVRACHGPGCVYPPGPGRAAKQSRKTLNSELVDRLSRLEAIIRSRALPDPETSSTRSVEVDKYSVDTENTSSVTNSLDYSSSIDRQLGRLVIDETKSYYISNILWANLGSEIEELRNLLAEPAFEDENGQYENISPAPLGSNAAMLGFRALAYSLQSYHPPLHESAALLQVFTENVVPMVRIFHIPTTTRMYWDVIARLDSIDKNTEALLFAIYYSAVISMDPEQCINIMGLSREAAIEKYRFAVEQAMARANLLNTQSIILLQAAVLFLSALSNEDDSRTVWSLTSLVFHIAKTMGLHRDGTAFSLKPFETELRRRLWLHICLLDQRSSEYHGGEPIVHEFTFDTKIPLHINDSDLIPEMTTPPSESDGFCEMTFSLIRSEAMRTAWKISHVPPSMRFPGRPPDGLSLKDRQILAEELKDRLHRRYLTHCDNRVPFQLLSLTVARLIIARIWLVVHWPPGGSGILQGDASMRDQLFLTSIEVLEQSSLLLTNKDISKWTWHSKTHIQWHAVAFVLSEICSRPPSPDCNRAWEHVCTVYDVWKTIEHEKKGTLWRPINRLMAKARYVREMQRLSYAGRAVPLENVFQGEEIQSTLINSNLGCLPATNGASGVIGMDDMQTVLGMESLDPLMELFPDNYGMDPFGMNQDYNDFFV